eukprot:TRINITY_DN2761_c0_g1_i1.p1 TRINITY_DN2761_c0_g1~~TRINITY_DN2761_c0_g1_i1.p1  ORF type:complete len:172 (+),score=61.68 TRINITY_DN2761_c0_g1_i1:144-659(+)
MAEGMTREEEEWLMRQIAEEEANLAGMDDGPDEEEGEDEHRQHAGLRLGEEEELTEQMQRDMVHFLNTTGQEAEDALKPGCKERRLDHDGSYYPKEAFIQYYGGLDEWKASPVEKRLDTDGLPYSYTEFVSFYSEPAAAQKWEGARPQDLCQHFPNCSYAENCRFVHPRLC